MVECTDTLPAALTLHTRALPGSTYSLPPMQHANGGHVLPSAPPPSEIYQVLPPIPSGRIYPVPEAQVYTVPTSQTAAKTSSACTSSSSACGPSIIATVVVAILIVAAVIAAAVIVTNNNSSSNDSNSGNVGTGDVVVVTTESPCDFRCNSVLSTQCIPHSEVCDGDSDCPTGEDEIGCTPAPVTCDGYMCASGAPFNTGCIPSSWICDGYTDCLTGDDEYGCFSTPQPVYCWNGTLYCDGICISSSHVCDGVDNCGDGSDEYECPGTVCAEYLCPYGVYSQYGSTSCIEMSLVCDGIDHCIGGYDEENCSLTTTIMTCTSNSVYCDGTCIPNFSVCDGHSDCSNSADEQNCTTSCSSHEFTCTSGSDYTHYGYCIPLVWQCDEITDCQDGEDEKGCDDITCSPGQFTCVDGGIYGNCIPDYWECDNYVDCVGATDEANCSCDSHQYNCQNGSSTYGSCISNNKVCDGVEDCNDGADEVNCDITCSATQFICVDGGPFGTCIPDYWECDDYVDCLGATDEANCSCDTTEYRCQNGSAYGSCISSDKLCDGTEDCNEGSDEANCAATFTCIGLSSATITLPKLKVCDGVEDCLGGVDENKCIVAPNGVDGGIVNIYNVAEDTYYNFCSDNWMQSTGDEACAAMGYSAMTTMKNVTSSTPIPGIRVDAGGSFRLSELTHRSPVNCPLNTIIEFKCSRNVSCGLTSKSQPRVVGGEDTTIEEHPWQISLQQGSVWSGWSHFCGESIIGSDWVVTAAHCVDFISTYTYYRVVAGVTSLTQTISETLNAYSINIIVPHPLYNTNTNQYDVALIQVDRNFILSLTIQFVCVPAPGELFPDVSNVLVSGWGATSEGGNGAEILQAATVQLYNTESCCNQFTSLTHGVTDGMICAGYSEGNVDTCQGDSGGPLIAERNSREFLAGVTSWGYGCARPGLPGIYAEVSDAADWIKREIRKLQ